MNWNRSVRRTHRWISIVFTATILVVAIAASGGEEPAEWVFFLPLPLLFLLALTGLYLFVLPYVGRWRGRRGAG